MSEIELDIGVTADPDRYDVRVIESAAGEATGSLRLNGAALLARRGELQATVLASAVSARRALPDLERPLREIGQTLFEALFTGPVYGRYQASLAAAQERGEGLRVVLRLGTAELAALPWEALFDPEREAYLCRQEPLVRHVPALARTAPMPVAGRLRILGVVAAPSDLPQLDVAEERQRVERAMADPISRGLVEVVWAAGGSWAELQGELLNGTWHAIHFVGHGGFDPALGEGVLALVGDDGRAELVEATRFTDLLQEAYPAPRLVVLNACSSGETGTHDVFSSTAAALVRRGVSAVVAMQWTVSDQAALAFTRGFYAAVAAGRGVDEAVRSGRRGILGTGAHSLEWVTPVLYLRGRDAHLFVPSPSVGTSERATADSGPEVSDGRPSQPREDLRVRYMQAMGELRTGHYADAITLFDSLLSLDSTYEDAPARRESARRSQRLITAYQRARTAEAAQDWIAAVREFTAVIDLDPDYRDAASRREACDRRQRVDALIVERQAHAQAGNWQAVTAVDADLEALGAINADSETFETRIEPTPEEADERQQTGQPAEQKAGHGNIARVIRRHARTLVVLLTIVVLAAVSLTVRFIVQVGQPGPGTIALLLPELSTPRFAGIDRPHFEDKLKQICAECQVMAANAEQGTQQQQQADSAMAQGARVLVLDPVDAAAAASIASSAKARNVSVIAYDRFIEGADYFVSFDHQKVGELAAKSLTGHLGANATSRGILMINGPMTDDVAVDFKRGAHSVIDASGVPVLAEYDTPDWSPSKAQDWVGGQLSRVRGRLVGVYVANDAMAAAAIAAMKAAGVNPLPPVTGQDAQLSAIQRIVTGEQYMTVYKSLGLEAERAAEAGAKLLNGEKPTTNGNVKGVPSALLEGVAVTKENVKTTVVADNYLKITDICTPLFAQACATAGLS